MMQSCFSAPIEPQNPLPVFPLASASPNESTLIPNECANDQAKTVPGDKAGFLFAELLGSHIEFAIPIQP